MGRLGADAFAEQVAEGNVGLRAALTWHLRSNHFPPLPAVFVPVAEKAIELADQREWDTEIPLPDGILNARDERPVITVGQAVEAFHLDSFITWDEE